jgi:hypothetical protein
MMGLQNCGASLADAAMDDNAPSQRVLMGDADLWDWSKEQGRPWFA